MLSAAGRCGKQERHVHPQLKSLGTASQFKPGKVANVELLGCVDKLEWTQSAESLTVENRASGKEPRCET